MLQKRFQPKEICMQEEKQNKTKKEIKSEINHTDKIKYQQTGHTV